MRYKKKRRLITGPEYNTFYNNMNGIAESLLSGTVTTTAAIVRTMDELDNLNRRQPPARAVGHASTPRRRTKRELVTIVREWQRSHPHEVPTAEIQNAHRLLSRRGRRLPGRQEIARALHQCRLQLRRRHAARSKPPRPRRRRSLEEAQSIWRTRQEYNSVKENFAI